MKALFGVFFFVLVFFMIVEMKHVLNFLISLEMLALVFFSCLIFFHTGFMSDFFLFLFFIVSATMESVVGLVLFVGFMGFWSKDYVFSLAVLKF